MTNEQIEYCVDVYNKMIDGAYNPADLQKTYTLLSGDESAVTVRRKRQTLYGWYAHIYPTLIKKVEEPIEEIVGNEGLEIPATTKESIDLVKSTSTKKKRVYKRKPKAKKNESK